MSTETYWKPGKWIKHYDNLLAYIENRLNQNEKMIAAIPGMVKTKVMFSEIALSSVLVCTNQRLILYGKNMGISIGEKFESYPLNHNVTLNVDKGFITTHLVIRAANDIQKIQMSRENGHKLIELVNEQIHKNTQIASNQAPSEDPLDILKLRYAKGEITTNEFEEMKKRLS